MREDTRIASLDVRIVVVRFRRQVVVHPINQVVCWPIRPLVMKKRGTLGVRMSSLATDAVDNNEDNGSYNQDADSNDGGLETTAHREVKWVQQHIVEVAVAVIVPEYTGSSESLSCARDNIDWRCSSYSASIPVKCCFRDEDRRPDSNLTKLVGFLGMKKSESSFTWHPKVSNSRIAAEKVESPT